MMAPSFWYTDPQSPAILARILSPMGTAYAAATARRIKAKGYQASIPVICIGNINVGGTGKTPTAMALAMRLIDKGHNPHIVSRGFGGRLDGPVKVIEQIHSASEVGDEPLLLSAFAPTWVAKDRAAGVRSAEAADADVILLDDGLQNPSVVKDLSIVVVDAQRGFGNQRVLPAGPLRETLIEGFKRTDFLLSIGDEQSQTKFGSSWPVPVLQGVLKPLETGLSWAGMRVFAFAGIGHPEKFFRTLKGLGCDVIRSKALEDHQRLSEALMKRLYTEATLLGAQLVTTEKDAVRLSPNYRSQVLTLPVRLEIPDWSPIDTKLATIGL